VLARRVFVCVSPCIWHVVGVRQAGSRGGFDSDLNVCISMNDSSIKCWPGPGLAFAHLELGQPKLRVALSSRVSAHCWAAHGAQPREHDRSFHARTAGGREARHGGRVPCGARAPWTPPPDATGIARSTAATCHVRWVHRPSRVAPLLSGPCRRWGWRG